jgi:hypothetical protein
MTMTRTAEPARETSEQYWHRLIREQKLRMERIESRLSAMEAIFFTLEPSQLPQNFDSNQAVADFLGKHPRIDSLTTPVCEFLNDRLTPDWRLLTKKHGYFRVFELLAQGRNIIEARRALS